MACRHPSKVGRLDGRNSHANEPIVTTMAPLKRFLRSLLAAYQAFNRQDGPLLAAAIAYYLAFSLFPMMLVFVAILGWGLRFTSRGQDAQQYVLSAVNEQVSPELGQQLARSLNSVESHAAASGALGALMLLVTSLAIFTQIDYAFDRLWEIGASQKVDWRRRIRQLIFVRLKSVVMLMAVGGFVLAVMIASLVWKGFRENAAPMLDLLPHVNRLLEPLVHIALNCLAFSCTYRFVPKTQVPWRAALAGGWLAAALWEVGRQLLAAFVVTDRLPTAYGVIGSFMAVMLWTYYAMLVLLFGAALARVLTRQTRLGHH